MKTVQFFTLALAVLITVSLCRILGPNRLK